MYLICKGKCNKNNTWPGYTLSGDTTSAGILCPGMIGSKDTLSGDSISAGILYPPGIIRLRDSLFFYSQGYYFRDTLSMTEVGMRLSVKARDFYRAAEIKASSFTFTFCRYILSNYITAHHSIYPYRSMMK
jgi:hypothetical protein